MEKKYLNEEKYQSARKKFIIVGVVIIAIAMLIGGALIVKGVTNKKEVSNEYTEANKQKKVNDLKLQYSSLELQIQPKLDEITALMREKNRLSYFDDKDRWDEIEDEMAVINREIKPVQDNMLKLKSDIFFAENENVEFQKGFNSNKNIIYFMMGGFIILAGALIGGSVILVAYRRNILAYGVQSVIPVGKEVIDEMAPTIGNAVGEIAKGIKKGLKDEE